jgi:paraquat-inducible protein B
MSTTSKTTAVGVFVLIAIVLAIMAIVIFGGGRLFEKRIGYVVYFDGSVTGLNVGSAVTFRGVKVGSVSDIQVTINNDEELVRLPVFIDINPDRFSGLNAGLAGEDPRVFISHLVRRGLRAQLQVQSLVTGQLMVDLDFHPENEATYSGVEHDVPELPAIPSDLEVLSKSLKQLPVEEIVNRLLRALEGIDNLVNSPRVPETLTLVRDSTARLETLLKQLNEQMGPMMTDAQTTVKEIKELVTSARKHVDPLAENVDNLVTETRHLLKEVDSTTETMGTKVGEATDAATRAFTKAETVLEFKEGAPARIAQSLEETAKAANQTLVAAEKAMERVDAVLADDSPLRAETLRTLREISDAVHSVQVVAEYLQRHPEALLRGKGKPGEQ